MKFIHGNCMNIMPTMTDNSVDFTLTDIPYAEVSRSSNGLRKLDKENADILTFDLDKFLTELIRVTKNSMVIFCGREQFSGIYARFTAIGGGYLPSYYMAKI